MVRFLWFYDKSLLNGSQHFAGCCCVLNKAYIQVIPYYYFLLTTYDYYYCYYYYYYLYCFYCFYYLYYLYYYLILDPFLLPGNSENMCCAANNWSPLQHAANSWSSTLPNTPLALAATRPNTPPAPPTAGAEHACPDLPGPPKHACQACHHPILLYRGYFPGRKQLGSDKV